MVFMGAYNVNKKNNENSITYHVRSMYLRNLNYDTHIMVLNLSIYKFRHAVLHPDGCTQIDSRQRNKRQP